GKPPHQAIYEAALLRFRPIMMTTMAALLGVLPIAIGVGAGAELRQPLGVAVVGGLLVSQLLTLYHPRPLRLHGAPRRRRACLARPTADARAGSPAKSLTVRPLAVERSRRLKGEVKITPTVTVATVISRTLRPFAWQRLGQRSGQ